jgi:hypothetical protein
VILLGYEFGTGAPVEIPLGHLVVIGQTQESGKTTTLEALISRHAGRGLAFVTKRGESSFRVAQPIPPYFRERCDWPFVASILEATISEKLKFQRAWIMKLCQEYSEKKVSWKAPRSLADVAANCEKAMETSRGISNSVYTELREYLRIILPEIERLEMELVGCRDGLRLSPGLNVMDLSDYIFPVQALVVRSSLAWINKRETNTIAVIPEAWQFAPKQRGSPVKLAAEEFIRQGAALRNYIWLDCQDLAGVADVLLRQVKVWIFGVQRATREIERTLEHIPANLKRPKPAEIAMLGRGQFIVCWEREMRRVYVRPAWMSAAHAEAIARGEENVDSARLIANDYDQEHK